MSDEDDTSAMRDDLEDFVDDLDDDEDLDGGIVPDDYDDLDDEDDDVDDEYDDEDDYEDATPDEVDFVIAVYTEEGQRIVAPLNYALANDLDDFAAQLRRLPADAGVLGIASLNGDFFVLIRLRGRAMKVLLSDNDASHDWPIARDVVDYLGIDLPEDDDDSEPVGDLDMLADLGVSEFDLERIAGDPEEDSEQLVLQIAKLMHVDDLVGHAIDS